MKKLVTFFVIVVLCTTANLQVFSQKIRTADRKRLPDAQTESPVIKDETRGIKNEAPTGVKLRSAEAFSDGNGVFLRWQAEYENRNLGFLIYREGKGGRELVSGEFVRGGLTKSSDDVSYGAAYSYFDRNGDLSAKYFIESLPLEGGGKIIGQAIPQPVSDLAPIAGASAWELASKAEAESPALENSTPILPGELGKLSVSNAAESDINTQRWIAAQPGVKISVKQEGIYRVSRAQLEAAGFNVNSPANLWQLYTDGKEQSIIVGANDSYVEFYGKGIDTPETDTRVYYLLVGAQNGLRMANATVRPLSGNVAGTSYFQTFERKERKVYLTDNILNGDAENFFGQNVILGSNSTTPTPATLTFELKSVDFNVGKAAFEISIQGINGTPHQFVPTLNGEQLDPINGNGFNLMTRYYDIPTSFLREGTNTLQIRSFGGAGANGLPESLRVHYQRKFEALQNRLLFYTNNYRQTTISGFASPNIRVFDLTYPDNPSVLSNLNIQNNGGNHSVTIPSSRGRVAIAVEDSAILSATSIVANNPSTLSTAARNGELIIVSYKDWMTQAEDWANYRRAQGMAVEVVNIEDIYDEFSYGAMNTVGMTEFFQFAKNNWQTPPKYILLIGDMSYDFRNYENRPFQNFIPTKRVDTVYEETGSDEALSDFNNDGLAEIAIGRIPARNAATVTQLLGKTMTFESSLATAFNRGALFASDLPVGYDFEALSQRVANQLPGSIPKTFINRGQPDSRNLLLTNLSQGPYLVNYSGHGASGSWQSNWLAINDAPILTNAPNYTLYFMLTCLNGYFIRTDFDSLGEALLKAPNGGGVAVWASTGKTTPDVQEVLAARFYNQLSVGSMTRLGDLITDAKQNLNGGRDVRLSWALLGDPTMKIKP